MEDIQVIRGVVYYKGQATECKLAESEPNFKHPDSLNITDAVDAEGPFSIFSSQESGGSAEVNLR